MRSRSTTRDQRQLAAAMATPHSGGDGASNKAHSDGTNQYHAAQQQWHHQRHCTATGLAASQRRAAPAVATALHSGGDGVSATTLGRGSRSSAHAAKR